MAKRVQSVDSPPIEEHLGQLRDVKRRLVEAGMWNSEASADAREILRNACSYLRIMRENLESNLLDRTLEDMTPEQALEAIGAMKLMEAELSPPLDS
jgi:hypothetical protein